MGIVLVDVELLGLETRGLFVRGRPGPDGAHDATGACRQIAESARGGDIAESVRRRDAVDALGRGWHAAKATARVRGQAAVAVDVDLINPVGVAGVGVVGANEAHDVVDEAVDGIVRRASVG